MNMKTFEFDVDNLTPLMKQYQQIKQNYRDCILFFRLGDFYELFGEDALLCAPILGVVLTKRQNVPMCGVPFHSVNNYISKLLSKGFKIAICEQVEDPKLAKGIVKREVTRVITPGTIIEENLLDVKKNNYLVSINLDKTKDGYYIGIAAVDISTGDFLTTQFEDKDLSKLLDELIHFSAVEVVTKQSSKEEVLKIIKKYKDIHIEILEDWYFDAYTASDKLKDIYKVINLIPFGLEINYHGLALGAIGGIIEYLERTQKKALPTLKYIKFYSLQDFLFLDNICIRNLELVENLYDGTSKNTLLEVIDKTQTPQGARLLRNWLLKPLVDIKEIKKRQSLVELFYSDDILRNKIRSKLKFVSDIERITNRIALKNATPKDLITLGESLKIIPDIKNIIKDLISLNFLNIEVKDFEDLLNFEDVGHIIELIDKSINPEAPNDIKKGNVIKEGYNKDLDEIRKFYSSSKEWLLRYQEEQRQKTQIQNLKVGYTSVFGYYIEITKSNLHLVPKDYIRKQTLKNAERFITNELKEFEEKILSSEEKMQQLEEYLFLEILEKISENAFLLYSISNKIALIDVLCGLAEVAKSNKYTRPIIDDSHVIELKASRHPVLEQVLPKGRFIPNDVYIDGNEVKVIILTGPNMAGKSTYIRQIALCVILAQIGSFVPCEYARIGIVKKIFARIGASDYLAKGLSTFMVEMQETAKILHNACDKSLIILDEIGRGTSTYDGISIAWAVVEFLVNEDNWGHKGHCPKTLFATHYFELAELEKKYKGVKNFNVAVKEYKNDIVFLYKVVPGCSDKSYGIHVAKLAGIPQEVIKKAFVLLNEFQKNSKLLEKNTQMENIQLEFEIFKDEKIFLRKVLEDIKKIDINKITPLDAFQKIIEWRKILKPEQQIEEEKNG